MEKGMRSSMGSIPLGGEAVEPVALRYSFSFFFIVKVFISESCS
jgi:hypothetical protein